VRNAIKLKSHKSKQNFWLVYKQKKALRKVPNYIMKGKEKPYAVTIVASAPLPSAKAVFKAASVETSIKLAGRTSLATKVNL